MITDREKLHIVDLYLSNKNNHVEISNILNVDIDSVKEVLKDYNVLFEFRVFYNGWEFDAYAWIMCDANGEKYFAMSAPGGFPLRSTKSYLEKQVAELEKVLADSRKALSMLSQEEA